MTTPEQDAILAVLADIFPISPEEPDTLETYASLEYVVDSERDITGFEPGGDLRLTLRILDWELNKGAFTICGVKEQNVYLSYALLTDTARVEAYLRAWAEVLTRALGNPAANFSNLFPADLFFPGVLTLKRPKTQDQFIDAFIVRSRLGRYL